MEQFADEELVANYRAAAGDESARSWLDELFRRYHTRVGLWCLRLTGDRESAADLAQEVFLKAFRGLDSYRGESKFSTWLYTIARNHCFNQIKARSTRPEQIGDSLMAELADGSTDALSQLERESVARLVRDLVKDVLTETEGRVMTLHYGEDLPLEVVTRLLQLENASGAKAYIVSAKRKLQRALERARARDRKGPHYA